MHALGVGIKQLPTPLPAIAIIVELSTPWDETNREHHAKIDLVTQDGHPVMLGTDQNGNTVPLVMEMGFEVGRPPGVAPGSSMESYQVLNVAPNMPLTPGTYEWRLSVNGDPAGSRSFVVVAQQP